MHFCITPDEKSGYENVRVSNDSQGYFGMIFGGYVMVYTVIPFGFKADHWDGNYIIHSESVCKYCTIY